MVKIGSFLDLEWVDHSGCIIQLWKIGFWRKSILGWEMAKELLKWSTDRTAWCGSRTTWAPIPKPHTKAKCDSGCQWLSVQTGGLRGLSDLQASSAFNERVCLKEITYLKGIKWRPIKTQMLPSVYTYVHMPQYINSHTNTYTLRRGTKKRWVCEDDGVGCCTVLCSSSFTLNP